MRILVADDDPTYQHLLEDLLTEWHFDVALAADGLEALRIMRGGDPPSLAILDWEMPGADGFEVAKAIRREDATQDCYVILITGDRNKKDVMKVLVCGADDYLIKPFDPMDLKIHLRSAMRLIHLQEEVRELRRSPHGETAHTP